MRDDHEAVIAWLARHGVPRALLERLAILMREAPPARLASVTVVPSIRVNINDTKPLGKTTLLDILEASRRGEL